MRTTAAVVREKEQPFSLENLELEEPRADEVLVRVVIIRRALTVCPGP
jgi:Zn-dependent alcohol dehydrogenase